MLACIPKPDVVSVVDNSNFGEDADSMRMILNGCKESGNFLELLDLYSPDGAKSLDKLREQQYKHGGIV